MSSSRLTDRALALVRHVLDASQPQNLDAGSISVTGEGPDVGVILLPHRDLGGYALVLWFEERQLQLAWAGVTDLERHDDLDLGKRVYRANDWTENEEATRAAIESEVRRPIRVTLRKTRILGRCESPWVRRDSGAWI